MNVCWIETHEDMHDALDYGTAVVFAADEESAIMKATTEWHNRCYDELVYGIVRAPQFDRYSELGYVPAEALLADGWFLTCGNCDQRITEEGREVEEDELDEGVELTDDNCWTIPFCVGQVAYCSQRCHDIETERFANDKRIRAEVLAEFNRLTKGKVKVASVSQDGIGFEIG